MRLERYISPFFLALLISLPLLPVLSDEAHPSLLGRGGYGKKVRMKIGQEKWVPPRKRVKPGPRENGKENILIILDATSETGKTWAEGKREGEYPDHPRCLREHVGSNPIGRAGHHTCSQV